MRILGIDPGSQLVGYGVIAQDNSAFSCVAYGSIQIHEQDTSASLEKIHTEVGKLIAQYKPDIVGVESLYFHKNQKTAMAVSQARGVILLSCAQHNVTVREATPLQIKQAVTGYGKATKHDIQKMVQLILRLDKKPSPDDAADALAAAICVASASAIHTENVSKKSL